MEQLDYNLLFHWFVGLGVDDPMWDVTVLTKNRDRLLAGAIAAKFLRAVLARAASSSTSTVTTPVTRPCANSWTMSRPTTALVHLGLPGVTMVSKAHKPSVVRFHGRSVELRASRYRL